MKFSILNLIQGALTKSSIALKRDFNEVCFLRSDVNLDKFFNTACEKVFTILVDNLKSGNLNYGFILVKENEYKIIKKSPVSIYWVIKPVDGIVNFKNRVPFFSIVISLVDSINFKHLTSENILLSLAFDVMKDELFFAKQNEGAFLMNKRQRITNHPELSLIGGPESFCTRNFGCDSLHFAYLSNNSLDGVVAKNLDIATKTFAQLITQESKGFFGYKENKKTFYATSLNNEKLLEEKI